MKIIYTFWWGWAPLLVITASENETGGAGNFHVTEAWCILRLWADCSSDELSRESFARSADKSASLTRPLSFCSYWCVLHKCNPLMASAARMKAWRGGSILLPVHEWGKSGVFNTVWGRRASGEESILNILFPGPYKGADQRWTVFGNSECKMMMHAKTFVRLASCRWEWYYTGDLKDVGNKKKATGDETCEVVIVLASLALWTKLDGALGHISLTLHKNNINVFFLILWGPLRH